MSTPVMPLDVPPPASPPDLLSILTDNNLARLRAAYSRNLLLGLAPKMVAYPKTKGFTEWISTVVFQDGAGASSLSPAEREMVIVAVLATERDTFVLSGHLYWALMEGLSVEKLADTLATVATYTGINDMRYSSCVLKDVLLVLKDAIDTQADLSTGALVKVLTSKFTPY